MKRDTITQAEYLQLIGLQALGKKFARKESDIEDAMYSLIGTDGSEIDAGDTIWGDRPIEWFLERNGVAVEKEKK